MDTQISERLDRIEELLKKQSLYSKDIFNIEELAEYIGMSISYIYKIHCKNEIPSYKPNGKTLFFKRTEIDLWLLRNRQSTNEEIEAEAISYSTLKLK